MQIALKSNPRLNTALLSKPNQVAHRSSFLNRLSSSTDSVHFSGAREQLFLGTLVFTTVAALWGTDKCIQDGKYTASQCFRNINEYHVPALAFLIGGTALSSWPSGKQQPEGRTDLKGDAPYTDVEAVRSDED